MLLIDCVSISLLDKDIESLTIKHANKIASILTCSMRNKLFVKLLVIFKVQVFIKKHLALYISVKISYLKS